MKWDTDQLYVNRGAPIRIAKHSKNSLLRDDDDDLS